MEFDIGKQCNRKDCSQLDFLPLTCEYCRQVFCKDHISIDGHQCSKYPKADFDGTGEMSTKSCKCHLESCTEKVLHSSNSDLILLGYLCDGCKNLFCVRHRHQQDHNCQVPESSLFDQHQKRKEAALLALKKHGMSLKSDKPSSTQEKKKLNPKVELMKMKMKATGNKSIPESSRLYLRLFYGPKEHRPIFVDKVFSLLV